MRDILLGMSDVCHAGTRRYDSDKVELKYYTVLQSDK